MNWVLTCLPYRIETVTCFSNFVFVYVLDPRSLSGVSPGKEGGGGGGRAAKDWKSKLKAPAASPVEGGGKDPICDVVVAAAFAADGGEKGSEKEWKLEWKEDEGI